jgi:hypothetical protein
VLRSHGDLGKSVGQNRNIGSDSFYLSSLIQPDPVPSWYPLWVIEAVAMAHLPPRLIRWHYDGVLDRLHFALYHEAHELAGKAASPTAAIVDSQSVKSAEGG